MSLSWYCIAPSLSVNYKHLQDEELNDYVERILPERYVRLERFINDHGSCGFAVGNAFSWADLALFDLIDESIHYGLFQFNEEVLSDLEAFYKRVLHRTSIAPYLHSTNRPGVPKFYERKKQNRH